MFKNVQDDNVELFSFDPNIYTIAETTQYKIMTRDLFVQLWGLRSLRSFKKPKMDKKLI